MSSNLTVHEYQSVCDKTDGCICVKPKKITKKQVNKIMENLKQTDGKKKEIYLLYSKDGFFYGCKLDTVFSATNIKDFLYQAQNYFIESFNLIEHCLEEIFEDLEIEINDYNEEEIVLNMKNIKSIIEYYNDINRYPRIKKISKIDFEIVDFPLLDILY